MIYHNIKSKNDYIKLLASGEFWEVFPELTGKWDEDKERLFPPELPKEYTKTQRRTEFLDNFKCGWELYKENPLFHHITHLYMNGASEYDIILELMAHVQRVMSSLAQLPTSASEWQKTEKPKKPKTLKDHYLKMTKPPL